MTENYDTSWDLIESNEVCLPIDEDAFERKYQEWKTRDWPLLLKDNLTFPFTVERMEDEDDAYFTDIAKHQPFRLGHIMKVINVEPEEDDLYGLIVQVRECRRKGYLSGDRGDILLPFSNKSSTSAKMQYFNQLSMILFPR